SPRARTAHRRAGRCAVLDPPSCSVQVRLSGGAEEGTTTVLVERIQPMGRPARHSPALLAKFGDVPNTLPLPAEQSVAVWPCSCYRAKWQESAPSSPRPSRFSTPPHARRCSSHPRLQSLPAGCPMRTMRTKRKIGASPLRLAAARVQLAGSPYDRLL